MITKNLKIAGQSFHLTLTDHTITQVNSLKSLYSTAYEDPESFEQVSAEISSTIKQISSAVEPEINDENLDELIQEIIKIVDDKAAQIQKQSEEKLRSHQLKNQKNKIFDILINPNLE